MKQHMSKATKYVRKNAWNGFWVAALSFVASTVWPTIEGWHSDKVQAEAIQTAVAPVQKELDDFKRDQAARDKVQWEKISELMKKK